MALFCARPHAKTIDFATARFVVTKACGLDIPNRHLEMGEEIPQGALDEYALRCEYEPPLRRIELLDFALTDPDLKDLVLLRRESPPTSVQGSSPEPEKVEVPPAKQEAKRLPIKKSALSLLTHSQLVKFCDQMGVPTDGSKQQLRDRLRPFVG